MRWMDMLRLRMRSLTRRGAVEGELDDELQFHLEKQIEQNVAAGMAAEEAARAARVAFGNVTVRKEECREARGMMRIENLFQDLRHGARALRRDPVLAIAATATLAIAIGANTTMFSLVNSILLRPLPYPGSERICWIQEHMGRMPFEGGVGPDYYSLREESRVFEDVAAYDPTTVNWSGIGKPEQLDAIQATASFFRVMGTQPMMGRYLAAGEEGSKAPPVVVLSYALWRSRLGSDPNIVGKTMVLDGLTHTVIGVMPQGFDYPSGTQLWRPLPMDEADQRPRSPSRPMRLEYILARLKPRVTEPALQVEMERLTGTIRAQYPPAFTRDLYLNPMSIVAVPLQRRLTGDLRPALTILSGAVGLVLLIACVNLANLLLARSSARQRDLAVRLAIGSGRGRIIAQMLCESMLLALPGGLAGAALAWLAVALLNAAKPMMLDRYPAISLDLVTLAFTFAVTFATGLIFGTAPALAAARIDIQGALKSAGQLHSGNRSAGRLRRALVVVELGVSLVLLIGAVLLGRSFVNLARTDLGFPADHLLTMTIKLVRANYATAESQMQFWEDVMTRVKRLPMVRDAAVALDLPLISTPVPSETAFQIAGRAPLPMAQRLNANTAVVSREYFATLGIPRKDGRKFEFHEPKRVVVNEAFVRKMMPGEVAVGQRLLFGPEGRSVSEIIGVVGDTRGSALGAAPQPIIYSCECEGTSRFLTRLRLAVRTTGDPRAAIHAVEGQVYAIDRNQPVTDVKTMDERVDAALSPQRFQLMLIGTFAAIALLLAAAGVYGVISYLVTRRTREIGIRMAMGARPADVLRLVMRESVALVLIASAAGIAGAWMLTRYIKSMLYGVTTLDPVSFAIAPVVLGAIVLAASFGPARRAAEVDPITALRDE